MDECKKTKTEIRLQRIATNRTIQFADEENDADRMDEMLPGNRHR